jgi:hypothetical protein
LAEHEEPGQQDDSEQARGVAAEDEPAKGEEVPTTGEAGETPPEGPALDDLAAQIRAIRIGDFLLTTMTTLASLAYGKLEAGDLDEARGAIDAIRALAPTLEGRVEDQIRRDFEQALANLQIAYADAAAGASA